MTRRRAALAAAALVLAGATSAEAQAPRPLTASVEEVERRLAVEVDSLVRHALLLPEDDRRAAALRADSVAAVLVGVRPESADAQHWRAVTSGLLAEVSGPRDKVDLGLRAWERARRAVEIDERHPGAHHVLGRIHTGVLRLNWITRFIASRMGMGELVEAASWEEAHLHLARAVELAPWEPTFHLELAILLAERERPEEARGRLEALLRLPADGPLEARTRERALELLAELEGA